MRYAHLWRTAALRNAYHDIHTEFEKWIFSIQKQYDALFF